MARCLALIGWFGLVSGSTAYADVATAGQHFSRGNAHEVQGDLDLALAEFLASYEASPHPRTLMRIAMIYEQQGKRRDAGDYYERYISAQPDAGDAATVEAKLRELRETLSEIRITSDVAANVLVDGAPKGATPLTLTLRGDKTYRVEVTIDAGRAPSQEVAPAYGEAAEVVFKLRGTVSTNLAMDGRLYIDDVFVGSTKDQYSVAPGRHRVRIERHDYPDLNKEVVVAIAGAAIVDESAGPPNPASSDSRANLAGIALAGGLVAPDERTGLLQLGGEVSFRRFVVGAYGSYVGRQVGTGVYLGVVLAGASTPGRVVALVDSLAFWGAEAEEGLAAGLALQLRYRVREPVSVVAKVGAYEILKHGGDRFTAGVAIAGISFALGH